jgi:hypothetical protein
MKPGQAAKGQSMRATVAAMFGAFVFLSVSLFLPIWYVWYVGSWEANGHAFQFSWVVVLQLPQNIKQVGIREAVFSYNVENWVLAIVILALGAMFGWLRVWLKRKVETSK